MITSTQNEQVKYWSKLHQRKYREKYDQFFIEGIHLVEEAYKSGWTIERLIYTQKAEGKLPYWSESVSRILVTDQVFKHIAKTIQPQGIAAIVKMKTWNIPSEQYTLLIDAVQDPGNLGTLIRTADAAGFSKVILGKGTVDLFNEKVIRATQGSIFHLPIIQNDLHVEITRLQKRGVTILASTLHENSIPYHQYHVEGSVGIIVGNEGAGINEEFINMANQCIKIPIYGKAESLNVSIAAGILMYHVRK